MRSLFPVLAGFLLVAGIASMPFWVNSGVLFLAGLTLIAALFAMSWNILFGYVGLASFGHAGFFAIGAYSTGAALRYQIGLPFLADLVLAAAFGAAVAWLVGIIALRRLAGVFLAVLTVALSEVLRLVISYTPFLGRDDGLNNIPRPTIGLGVGSVDLSASSAYFWFILLVTGLTTALLWWLVNSRFGRVFQTIRQDGERSAFLGTNVAAYRLAAFMISGAVAALAGALFAPWTRIVTLDEVSWLQSTQPMLNTMLGGAGSFWGPAVGAVAFSVISYATRDFLGLTNAIIGGLLLLIILAAPTGLIGIAKLAATRLIGPSHSSRLPK